MRKEAFKAFQATLAEPPTEEQLLQLKDIVLTSHKGVAKGAIQQLSKLKNTELIPFYIDLLEGPYVEEIRKDAAGAIRQIGSLESARDYLIPLLDDYNPEIQMQAVLGLLPFKCEQAIKENLMTFYQETENELLKNILDKELLGVVVDTDTRESHIEVSEQCKNKLVLGDALSTLKCVPDNTFHLTFTSPPYYNARDYAIYPSYQAYLNSLEAIFKEVHRTTKDGRFLIVNTSPVIIPRADRSQASTRYPIPYDLHSRLTAIGWEFVEDIIWVKPEASVKSRVGIFHKVRKPLIYKPNAVTESIMVYRKKSNRLIDWSLKCYSNEQVEMSKVTGPYESTNVWNIPTQRDKVHNAVFPRQLCANILDYYSFKGDLVFEPFAGSGTLIDEAVRRGRHIFATEISPAYFEYTKERLQAHLPSFEFTTFEDWHSVHVGCARQYLP